MPKRKAVTPQTGTVITQGFEPGPPPRSEKEKYWRREILHQQNSSMSVVQYCTANGLGLSSFKWWENEIRKRDKIEAVESICLGTDVDVEEHSNPFVALRLEEPASSGALEIFLPGGAAIKITETTPMNLLARVLKMLEGTRC